MFFKISIKVIYLKYKINGCLTIPNINTQNNKSAWIYLVSHRQKKLMPNSEVIGIGHSCLIQRNVHIIAFTWSFSNIVEIALTQIRPKWTMFESVDGKVKHPLITNMDTKLFLLPHARNLFLVFKMYTEGHCRTSAELLGRDAHPNRRRVFF